MSVITGVTCGGEVYTPAFVTDINLRPTVSAADAASKSTRVRSSI